MRLGRSLTLSAVALDTYTPISSVGISRILDELRRIFASSIGKCHRPTIAIVSSRCKGSLKRSDICDTVDSQKHLAMLRRKSRLTDLGSDCTWDRVSSDQYREYRTHKRNMTYSSMSCWMMYHSLSLYRRGVSHPATQKLPGRKSEVLRDYTYLSPFSGSGWDQG